MKQVLLPLFAMFTLIATACGHDTPTQRSASRPAASTTRAGTAAAPRGVVLRCGHGAHRLDWLPGPAVRIGPVAFVGLGEYAGAPPTSFAPLTGEHRGRLPGVEVPVVVSGVRSVTLSVPEWERGHVRLLTRRSARLQVGGYRLSDGVAAMTIRPCARGSTVVYSGFVVVGRRCAAIDVLVAGRRPLSAVLSFGAGRCGRRASPPAGLPVPGVERLESPSSVTSMPVTRRLPARARRLCAKGRLPGVRIALLCPTLLPAGAEFVAPSGPAREPFFYSLLFNVRGAMAGPAEGRLIVGAGSPQAVRRYLLSDASSEVPGRPSLVATARLHARTVRLYRFPPDPRGGGHGGDVAAVARRGRVVVFASVHGYRHADAALAVLRSLRDLNARRAVAAAARRFADAVNDARPAVLCELLRGEARDQQECDGGALDIGPLLQLAIDRRADVRVVSVRGDAAVVHIPSPGIPAARPPIAKGSGRRQVLQLRRVAGRWYFTRLDLRDPREAG